MNETPMTPERFRHLADAYGASIGRWPEPSAPPRAH